MLKCDCTALLHKFQNSAENMKNKSSMILRSGQNLKSAVGSPAKSLAYRSLLALSSPIPTKSISTSSELLSPFLSTITISYVHWFSVSNRERAKGKRWDTNKDAITIGMIYIQST